jgi:hypothetical protein
VAEYDRLIVEWLANERTLEVEPSGGEDILVSEVLAK